MIPLRDENPRRRPPVVTSIILGVNVVLFLYELALGARLDGFLMSAAFVPDRLFAAHDLQLDNALLSMFLHGGFAHIIGNMLFLWIFADNIEDKLGHLRFALFYLACGFSAAYAHALATPSSPVPTIGASGAIAGVLGAYLVLFPRARILTLVWLGFFITTVQVPAILYLPFWFLIQIFSGLASLGSAEGGGVAWFAHIGGFAAGPFWLWAMAPKVFRQRARGRSR